MSEFVFSAKPITIERGEGATLYDDRGRSYVDAGASYGCVPLGHGHPAVTEAITDQLEDLVYVQGSYPIATRSALVERLSEFGPGDCSNVWLCNSGTEANEAALKFARSATGNEGVVATTRAFHGRTMGALSATWKSTYREAYEPLVPGFDFAAFGDGEALDDHVDENTAAIILEPIQGEGGVYPASDTYLQRARELADEVGAALILDEIQTGMGRTGSLWACQAAGVTPDIVTTAKGLANGLPIGTTLCRDWIADGAASHGSTYSGTPAVAAAAETTLQTIVDEDLPSRAARMGERLRDGLSDADVPIRDVRGSGLLVGIEVKRGAMSVLKDLALEEGVLALPAGRTVVRLLPPLVIEPDEIDRIVDAIAATVEAEADD